MGKIEFEGGSSGERLGWPDTLFRIVWWTLFFSSVCFCHYVK